MSLPPKLPKKTAVSNVVIEFPSQQHCKRMISFIEPLAFLQSKADQYEYTRLSERIQECVDELYSMLESQKLYN